MPLRFSTGTGRRARIPPWNACCSTMQYAYHAIGCFSLSEKLVGRLRFVYGRNTAKSCFFDERQLNVHLSRPSGFLAAQKLSYLEAAGNATALGPQNQKV